MQELRGPQPPLPNRADLATFHALQQYYERVAGFRSPEAELRQQRESTPDGVVGKQRGFPGGAMLMSLMMHTNKYTEIQVPALIIFANPHGQGAWVDGNTYSSVRAAAKAYSAALLALTEKQEKAVEDGVPTGRVVTLAGANHYVFLSNEVDVLREMRAFLADLH